MSAPARPPADQDSGVEKSLTSCIAPNSMSPRMEGESVGTLDHIAMATATSHSEGRRAKLKRISKPVASFLSVQIFVQLMTLISGLLLVRTMGKAEYAYYTIANTMQATINILGDSGVSSALIALGGVVWQDRSRFGALINTALEFRRKLGFAIFPVIGPLMTWLLYSNGASLAYSLLISGIVLGGASLSLTHGVLVTVPRLHSRVNQLQKAEFSLAALRLIMVGAACLVFIDAAVAAIIFVVTLAIQNVLYRRWAGRDADLSAPPNSEDRQEIWKIVRYQAPNSLFFCVQGQIFVLLMGIFGSASDVANVGALGRLTIFFSIISSLMTNLVLPRFARCQEREKLKSTYLQIVGCYLVLVCLFMVFVNIASAPILWVLGNKYNHLSGELTYLTFGTVCGAMAGVLYSLNAAKGWLKNVWISIPIIIVTQAAMIPFLDLSSIKNVALLGAIPTLLGSTVFVFQAYQSMRTFEDNPRK